MRVFVISLRSHRTWAVTALTLVGCFLLAGGFVRMNREAESSLALSAARQTPIYSVDTQAKKVSITLNAADGNADIPGILAALDEAGVKTTFFALGSWADRYPDDLAEIARRGHTVENHSDKHPHMNAMTADAIRKDIASAGKKIEALTGAPTTLFRAPYGEYNDLVVATARNMGHEVIQWSVDSVDWKGDGEDATVKRVLEKLKPGDIVLLHTNSKGIVPALARILTGVKELGYEAVPLRDLLLPEPYAVDRLGVQRGK